MRSFLSSLIILAFISVAAQAQPQTFNFDSANGSKQVTFESRAPVEYIEGSAEQVGGTATLDFDEPGLNLRASVSVPVASMRTGVDQRDEHLRSDEWLDAAKYPAIIFDLDPSASKKISAKGNGVWAGTVGGTFSLKGVTQKISVPVTIKQDADRLLVDGRFPVKLSDYHIYGPITMRVIGMKVSETVQVSFHLVGVRDKGWDNVKKTPAPSVRKKSGASKKHKQHF